MDDFDAGASDDSDARDHYKEKTTKVTKKPKPAVRQSVHLHLVYVLN